MTKRTSFPNICSLYPFSFSTQVLTFLQFGGYTLVRNSSDLFQSFGFDTQPVLIGLIIFQVLRTNILITNTKELHAVCCVHCMTLEICFPVFDLMYAGSNSLLNGIPYLFVLTILLLKLIRIHVLNGRILVFVFHLKITC